MQAGLRHWFFELRRWPGPMVASEEESEKRRRVSRDVITVPEIAELMKVRVQSVRQYAWNDVDFPKPLSRGVYSRKEIARYIAQRALRNAGRPGRPPRAGKKARELLESNGDDL